MSPNPPPSARQIELRLLTQLFEENRLWLLRMIASRTGDPDSAHDLVQETFLNAQKAARRLNLTVGSRAYLKRIAINLAGRYRQKSSRDIPTPDIEEQAVSKQGAESGQISSTVQQALNKLPEDLRNVARMRLFESMTFKEVSGRLDISMRTAKRRMEEAKKNLRRQLTGNRPEP